MRNAAGYLFLIMFSIKRSVTVHGLAITVLEIILYYYNIESKSLKLQMYLANKFDSDSDSSYMYFKNGS